MKGPPAPQVPNEMISQINPTLLDRFARLMEAQHLAHAYLFIGPEGIGKTQTALALAQLLNCDRREKGPACGICPTCVRIHNLQHPDVHLFKKPDGKECISIDQIRDLIGQSQLRSYEARSKVFMILEAECLTAEGSNAFLKTLEEPAPNTLFILTSSVPEQVFDTIRSRCQPIYFFPQPLRMLAQELAKDYSIEPALAFGLAYFAQGCPAEGRRLQEGDFWRKKNDIINEIVYNRQSETFFKKILGDKIKIKQALQVTLSWLRDLLMVKAAGNSGELVNFDRRNDLQKSQSQFSLKDLHELSQEVTAAFLALNENLNVKVALALIKEKLCQS